MQKSFGLQILHEVIIKKQNHKEEEMKMEAKIKKRYLLIILLLMFTLALTACNAECANYRCTATSISGSNFCRLHTCTTSECNNGSASFFGGMCHSCLQRPPVIPWR